MKITIDKAVLLPKLAQLAKVAGSKVVPILDDILLEAESGKGVHMYSGNGDISIRTFIDRGDPPKEAMKPSDLIIIRSGSATIPAKKLHEIVNKMGTGSITIESIEGAVKVKSGKSEYKLAGQDPEQFPEFPTPVEESIKMFGADFTDMVKRTKYAVAKEGGSAPILEGVKFTAKGSYLTATGCDRHRLSIVSTELKNAHSGVESVVKGTAFKDLLSMIDDKAEIDITFEQNGFFIETKDFTFYSRVLDGTYPVISKLIPEEFKTTVTASVSNLKAAVERALIIALDDKKNIIKMSVGVDEIVITSDSANDKAVESLEVLVIGEPINVSFNGKYMVEALSTLEDRNVTLCFNSVMQPIIFKTENTSDLQLILPYRTQ